MIWLMISWITMSFWEAVVRQQKNGKSIKDEDFVSEEEWLEE
jgi:hypothetical protein